MIYIYIHRLSLSIIEDITSGCSSSAFVLSLYLSAVSSIKHRAPTALYGGCFTFRWDPSAGSAVQKYAMAMEDPHFLTQPPKCGWVKTYNTMFGWMNIHRSKLLWVLTRVPCLCLVACAFQWIRHGFVHQRFLCCNMCVPPWIIDNYGRSRYSGDPRKMISTDGFVWICHD